ncbi:MAG: hypothetical protein M3Q03_01785 [Chloroflexota bacterium]|nr:hypothetical protein [Chloroflexota bacterium]
MRHVSEQNRVGARVRAALALTLTMVLAALTNPASASTELVINGGCEDPVGTHRSFQILGSIAGSTASSGSGIEVQTNAADAPWAGN